LIGRAAVALALVLATASTARAECAGRAEPRWVGHHSLIALVNPLGTEFNGRVGVCLPLFDSDSPLLRLNHMEVGASAYLSPIYLIPGGYVQLAPVSFLYVRAELHRLFVWPIPLSGAGFYLRDGYDQGWQRDDLPVEDGEAVTGWTARVRATVQAAVAIGDELELVLVSLPWLEINVLDRGDYWVDVRDDVIAANGDWIVANEGVLLFGWHVPEGPTVRLGAFTALRAVPASGYVGHRMGPFLAATFPRPDRVVSAVDVFIRLGVYTHHRFRQGSVSAMAGASIDFDHGGAF